MRSSEHPDHLTDPVAARRRRRLVLRGGMLLVVLALVATGAAYGVRGLLHNFGPPRCQATVAGRTTEITPEQAQNAATISVVAVRRGLPPRAASIAIATAWQESKLRDLDYGDRDSLGLFQQRSSQGWGSRRQILDPVHASNAFYDVLVTVPRWQSADLGEVAQKVQRSGFPQAYAAHVSDARTLASALTGQTPASLGCRLSTVGTVAKPATVATAVQHELGVAATTGQGSVRVRTGTSTVAWAAAAWAVAHAQQYGITAVTTGNRTWKRTREESGTSWHTAAHPTTSTTVQITLGGDPSATP